MPPSRLGTDICDQLMGLICSTLAAVPMPDTCLACTRCRLRAKPLPLQAPAALAAASEIHCAAESVIGGKLPCSLATPVPAASPMPPAPAQPEPCVQPGRVPCMTCAHMSEVAEFMRNSHPSAPLPALASLALASAVKSTPHMPETLTANTHLATSENETPSVNCAWSPQLKPSTRQKQKKTGEERKKRGIWGE